MKPKTIIIAYHNEALICEMISRNATEQEFLVLIENGTLQTEEQKEEIMLPYTLTYDKMPYIEDTRVFEPFTLADKIALRKPHHKQKRKSK
jgi:hypothetical protein